MSIPESRMLNQRAVKSTRLIKVMILVLSCFLFLQCSTKHKAEKEIVIADTVKRPANLSPNASLINIGEYDAPVYRWYEYGGVMTGKKLKTFYYDGRAKSIPDNRVFDDIHIINAYYPNGKLEVTDLFQVFPMEQKLSIDKTESYSIIDWWGTNTLKVETAKGVFILVSVFNLDKPFNSEKNLGYRFEQVPSIIRFFSEEIKAESYRLGSTYNISIKKSDQFSIYDLIIVNELSEEKHQKYKLTTNEKEPINLSLIRYYDPLLDRIYFVEDGYLEPLKN
jgi:hypothetical protein